MNALYDDTAENRLAYLQNNNHRSLSEDKELEELLQFKKFGITEEIDAYEAYNQMGNVDDEEFKQNIESIYHDSDSYKLKKLRMTEDVVKKKREERELEIAKNDEKLAALQRELESVNDRYSKLESDLKFHHQMKMDSHFKLDQELDDEVKKNGSLTSAPSGEEKRRDVTSRGEL